MLVEDHHGTLVLICRDDAAMILERTLDNMPRPGARLKVWSALGSRSWTDPQPLIEGFCGATSTPPVAIARKPGVKLRYDYMIERRSDDTWLAPRGERLRIREADSLPQP